jgi:hypothetical protein
VFTRSRIRIAAAAVSLAVFVGCSEVADPTVAGTEGATASSHLAYDCAAQSALTEAECEVLVTLYDATNGDGWDDATGWLVDADPCGWYGVTCWTPAPHVRRLDLDGNGLVGPIPADVADLSILEALILDGNDLTGGIPPELGDLAELRFLILSRNELTGSIPPELGALADLTTLFLRGNQLTGPIPSELGDLHLANLDLGENQLSGPIPPEIGDLSLFLLNLDGNLLSGLVPLAVADLGGTRAPQFCHFEDNLGLFMPDTQPYRDADVDGDGIICHIELGADSDGDGIPDALDPDVAAAVLETLPDAAFHSGGNRNALRSRLENIEADIAAGDTDLAIEKLMNLRARVDGCGAAADTNDWIVDCASQIIVRDLIDTLIAGLGG